MSSLGQDAYADDVAIQELAADIWNEKYPMGSQVTVFGKDGILIASVTESAARVGPLAPSASVVIRGMGEVLLSKVKPRRLP